MATGRVSPARSRVVLTVAALVAFAIGSTVAALALAPGTPSPVTTIPEAPVEPAAVVAIPTSTAIPVFAVPPAIRCHDIADRPCRALARAALAAAEDPTFVAIDSIDVWPTISCSSDFDCPRYRLEGTRPAGSAIVVTAGARQLWVNVTDRDLEGRRYDRAEHELDAWVIRTDAV